MNNILVKDIPILDRPRERLLKYGVINLSNEELLSIVLKNGTKNESVMSLSYNILKSINNITDLKNISINNLTKINGIGEVKAITLVAAIELGRRVYQEQNNIKVLLNDSRLVYDYLHDELYDKKQEYFIVLYLDNKKYLIEKKVLFIGTINKSMVHPREIFKYAYIYSASSIIMVHNHPSGDTLPSKEDITLTNSLKEIGLLNGIPIIDHIIIGNNNYFSFYKNNML
ncbi:MAG: DNA repair protein RadC [Bacilli bacterium]|nr:DNA repair protein RadC [Bacilli bacterium]